MLVIIPHDLCTKKDPSRMGLFRTLSILIQIFQLPRYHVKGGCLPVSTRLAYFDTMSVFVDFPAPAHLTYAPFFTTRTFEPKGTIGTRNRTGTIGAISRAILWRLPQIIIGKSYVFVLVEKPPKLSHLICQCGKIDFCPSAVAIPKDTVSNVHAATSDHSITDI
jgi:hypothetical protein